jgi:hypothetical protein
VSDTVVGVENVRIRRAQPTDLDQLARLLEALWLGSEAVPFGTMPLTIFVAEGAIAALDYEVVDRCVRYRWRL